MRYTKMNSLDETSRRLNNLGENQKLELRGYNSKNMQLSVKLGNKICNMSGGKPDFKEISKAIEELSKVKKERIDFYARNNLFGEK